MPDENNVNAEVAEVLSEMKQNNKEKWKWKEAISNHNEQKKVGQSARFDILIEKEDGCKIVIEGKVNGNIKGAEKQARNYLKHDYINVDINDAIALAYPEGLDNYQGKELRKKIRAAEFQYVILSRDPESNKLTRFPKEKCHTGKLRELAKLINGIGSHYVAYVVEIVEGPYRAIPYKGHKDTPIRGRKYWMVVRNERVAAPWKPGMHDGGSVARIFKSALWSRNHLDAANAGKALICGDKAIENEKGRPRWGKKK